jgi:hypothetical protein
VSVDSLVGIVAGYEQKIEVKFRVVAEIFLFDALPRLPLGTIQPPVQCFQRLFSQRYSKKVNLMTHIHLVPRLRICGAVIPPSLTTSWYDA